jgi:hypothetical protein
LAGTHQISQGDQQNDIGRQQQMNQAEPFHGRFHRRKVPDQQLPSINYPNAATARKFRPDPIRQFSF